MPSNGQQRAVRFFNDPSNILFEYAREIATLTHGVLVIAFMLLAGEHINTAPYDRDYRDAKIRRGLRHCLKPFGHSGVS